MQFETTVTDRCITDMEGYEFEAQCDVQAEVDYDHCLEDVVISSIVLTNSNTVINLNGVESMKNRFSPKAIEIFVEDCVRVAAEKAKEYSHQRYCEYHGWDS